MVYLLAVLAAAVVATGEVVQQRLAAQAPQRDNLSPKLLWWLARRPRWLAGVGCTFAGDVLFAAAVGAGSVVLVEAVFTVRLVFGLLISAAWGRRRVPLGDVLAAALTTAGLVAFLVVAQPRAASGRPVPGLRWGLGVGAVVVLGALLAGRASRLTGPFRALLLGLGAGAFFGLQASLMKRSVRVLADGGVGALLATWSGYAVVGAAVAGMLLVQSAFNAAELAASYPGVVTAQLLSSFALGIWVLGGSVRLGPIAVGLGLVALLAMLVGAVRLARSPLVTRAGAGHGRERNRP